MKTEEIEQGCRYQDFKGAIREVVEIYPDEITRIRMVAYRTLPSIDPKLMSDCTLKSFAWWAMRDVTESVRGAA